MRTYTRQYFELVCRFIGALLLRFERHNDRLAPILGMGAAGVVVLALVFLAVRLRLLAMDIPFRGASYHPQLDAIRLAEVVKLRQPAERITFCCRLPDASSVYNLNISATTVTCLAGFGRFAIIEKDEIRLYDIRVKNAGGQRAGQCFQAAAADGFFSATVNRTLSGTTTAALPVVFSLSSPHRPHGAIGQKTPIILLNSLPGCKCQI